MMRGVALALILAAPAIGRAQDDETPLGRPLPFDATVGTKADEQSFYWAATDLKSYREHVEASELGAEGYLRVRDRLASKKKLFKVEPGTECTVIAEDDEGPVEAFRVRFTKGRLKGRLGWVEWHHVQASDDEP